MILRGSRCVTAAPGPLEHQVWRTEEDLHVGPVLHSLEGHPGVRRCLPGRGAQGSRASLLFRAPVPSGKSLREEFCRPGDGAPDGSSPAAGDGRRLPTSTSGAWRLMRNPPEPRAC